MADKIIIFSGKQYSGKDTAAKILLEIAPEYKRCAMGDIIKLEYRKYTKYTNKKQIGIEGVITVKKVIKVGSRDSKLAIEQTQIA